MSDLRVAVLCGGFSSERAVSLKTGAAIERAIKALGHECIVIDVGDDMIDRLSNARPHVCYNALHGTFGEDGQIQSILAFLDIPCTGEDARTSLVAFDKALTKFVYEAAGVQTPPYIVLDSTTQAIELPAGFNFPLFLKPCAEGSSVGVERIDSFESLERHREQWQARPHLLESYIAGAELSVACLGEEILGSVEIVTARPFYDYEAKYGNSGTQYFIPPRLSAVDIKRAEEMALRAHRALGCRGLCRTDVIVNEEGAFVLETNTLPGMTESSLVPKIAHASGLAFTTLVQRVLSGALTELRKDTADV